jgi:DNA polymerase III delta prime subunit
MSAITQVKQQFELDRLEVAVDQAIAVCGGDMRSAIRSLIIANEFLEHEVKELFVAVSRGYARGRSHAAPDPLPHDREDWYD